MGDLTSETETETETDSIRRLIHSRPWPVVIPDFKCNEAHIISLPDDSDSISILVFIDGNSIQMQRPRDEKLIKAITRLNISLQKKSDKKGKSTKNHKKKSKFSITALSFDASNPPLYLVSIFK